MVSLFQTEQLLADSTQLPDLRIDFSEPAFNKVLSVSAGALPSVAYIEEFFDVRQPQAHALGRADEAQPLDCLVTIEAVAGGGPFCPWQKANPLVVAQRASAQSERSC